MNKNNFKLLRKVYASLSLGTMSFFALAGHVALAATPTQNPPGSMVGPTFTGLTVDGSTNDIQISPNGIVSTLTNLGLNLGSPATRNVVIGASAKNNVAGLVVGGLTSLLNDVTIGTVSNNSILQIYGSIRSENGTANAPAYSFAQATGTGMYRDVLGQVCFSVNGVKAWCVNEVTPGGSSFDGAISDGIVSNPGLRFINDQDTGIFRNIANTISFATNGYNGFQIDQFGSKATIGTNDNPSYSFIGDSNTGMYSPSSDSVRFATGGFDRFFIDNGGAKLAAGSAAAPSLSFNSDTNTGLYYSGTDSIAIATGGSNRAVFSNSGVATVGTLSVSGDVSGNNFTGTGYSTGTGSFSTSTGNILTLGGYIQSRAGNESSPAFTFNGATNTGLFAPYQALAMTLLGSERFRIDVNGFNFMNGNLRFNGSAGSAGQVLTSNGPSGTPYWSTPASGGTDGNGIYSGNGSLSGNRTVTMGTNSLAFTSTKTTSNAFSVDGSTFSIDTANNRVGIGTTAPSTTLYVNGTGTFSSTLSAGATSVSSLSSSGAISSSGSISGATLSSSGNIMSTGNGSIFTGGSVGGGSVTASTRFSGPLGSVSNTVYGYNSGTNLGMYFPSSASIGFSTSGVNRLTLSASGAAFGGTPISTSGSLSAGTSTLGSTSVSSLSSSGSISASSASISGLLTLAASGTQLSSNDTNGITLSNRRGIVIGNQTGWDDVAINIKGSSSINNDHWIFNRRIAEGLSSASHSLVIQSGSGSGADIVFRTANVDHMVVRNTGNVGIGRSPVTNRLEVNGQASKAAAGDWVANSDARLKKNISELDSETILEKLLDMRGVSYEWNDDKTGNKRPEGTQYGFIAQDIAKVWPGNVEKDADGYLQTAYGTYDFMYVESIKALYNKLVAQSEEFSQLKAENEELKALVKELSADNAEMKSDLADIKAKLGL